MAFPILILGKSIGLEWTTVRSLILMRLGPARQPASADIEDARLNFERLVPSTAQRVLTFWQARPATAEDPVTYGSLLEAREHGDEHEDPVPAFAQQP